MTEHAPALDLICLGRSSVDLYGEQVGGRLEDMSSFAKYIGGCPANVSIGAARLGLKSALVTRVGDEHMGRFIRETLEREGVDTTHVKTDPHRLTALVVLGIRDRDTFPLIFFRADCADMAIEANDIDAAFIGSAAALLVTGTHLSAPGVEAASRAAIGHARAAGARVVLDIDYRPVLWGLTGHGAGEQRFVPDDQVTARLQDVIRECDLVVGTEEEIHIAGGTTETMEALRRLRALCAATIVVKLGPIGCAVFPGAIPETIDGGVSGAGFPVEVFNVLGAGDSFISGFLRGWLRGKPIEDCCTYANACGALAVSRHGCAPAIPTWIELGDFLARGSPHRRLREDERINHIHWATTRRAPWPEVCALAFDHRGQFESLAETHDAGIGKIRRFKGLIWQAVVLAMDGDPAIGVIVDDRFGASVLFEAAGTGCWTARPVEQPGSVPLRFENGPDVTATLREWPIDQIAKCLVFFHPDDEAALKDDQLASLGMLHRGCRETGHELLLEVILPAERPVGPQTICDVLDILYGAGIFPDWWKLQPPENEQSWAAIAATIERHDPYCRGVLLLGLDAPEDDLARAFQAARGQPVCKGFAIGRSIFRPAAEAWFAGKMDDQAAVSSIAEAYGRMISLWRGSRATRGPSRPNPPC